MLALLEAALGPSGKRREMSWAVYEPAIRFDVRAERAEYERLFKHQARVLQDGLERRGHTDRTKRIPVPEWEKVYHSAGDCTAEGGPCSTCSSHSLWIWLVHGCDTAEPQQKDNHFIQDWVGLRSSERNRVSHRRADERSRWCKTGMTHNVPGQDIDFALGAEQAIFFVAELTFANGEHWTAKKRNFRVRTADLKNSRWLMQLR
jgi:hypothetical protein